MLAETSNKVKPNIFIITLSVISGIITGGLAIFIAEASNQGLGALWY